VDLFSRHSSLSEHTDTPHTHTTTTTATITSTYRFSTLCSPWKLFICSLYFTRSLFFCIHFIAQPSHHACLPLFCLRWFHFFFFLFKTKIWAKRTQDLLSRPIFIEFSPCDGYLIVNCRFNPFSRLLKGRCHGNQFRVKIGKIGLFTFIRSPGIPKGL